MQDVYDLFHDINRIWAHPRGEMCARSSGGDAESVTVALRDSMAEVKRVPANNDGGKEVQAGYAEVLAFGGAVADFALTADAQGVFERVVRFALVEPDLGPALQFGVEQPVDDEERPLDAPDLA